MNETAMNKDSANGQYSLDNVVTALPPANKVVTAPLPAPNVVTAPPPVNDPTAQRDAATFHTAIILLGVIVLVVVIAATMLAFRGESLSEGVVTIGATAIGGLAGIVMPRAGK